MFIKIVVVAGMLFVGLICYSCAVVAGKADNQMDKYLTDVMNEAYKEK